MEKWDSVQNSIVNTANITFDKNTNSVLRSIAKSAVTVLLNLIKVLDNLYGYTMIEPTIIEHNDSTLPIGSEAIEDRTISSNAMEEPSAANADDDYMSDTIVVQLLPLEKRR
jgi:hypothetical protein